MNGASVKKVILMFFFWQWSHLSFPKISSLTDPPFTIFAYIPKIFDKYQMPIFFIEFLSSLWQVRTWLKIDQTRPLHFQIFQILNATDRRIVHWSFFLEESAHHLEGPWPAFTARRRTILCSIWSSQIVRAITTDWHGWAPTAPTLFASGMT